MGLLLIVLAHVGPPYWLHELRTFDVPLMLFVSGLAYGGKKIQVSFCSFLKTRAFRLIIPAYIFLAVYFLLYSVMAELGFALPVPLSTMANSFLFRYHPEGIGYVWIIRVFLIVTVLIPLFLWINEHLKSERSACGVMVLMLFLQELLVFSLNEKGCGWLVEEWLLCLLGYSVMFLLGLRVRSMKNAVVCKYLAVLSCIFCAVIAFGFMNDGESFHLLSFNENKYPPRLYYLLYGMLASLVIWMSRHVWLSLLNHKLMVFIGQNTLWIYFWHVLLLKPVQQIIGERYWGLSYFLVLSLALLCFYFQYLIVSKIKEKSSSKRLSHLIGYLIG